MGRYSTFRHFRDFVRILVCRKVSAKEISAETYLSLPTVYYILKALEDVGFEIERHREPEVKFSIKPYSVNQVFFKLLHQEDVDPP